MIIWQRLGRREGLCRREKQTQGKYMQRHKSIKKKHFNNACWQYPWLKHLKSARFLSGSKMYFNIARNKNERINRTSLIAICSNAKPAFLSFLTSDILIMSDLPTFFTYVHACSTSYSCPYFGETLTPRLSVNPQKSLPLRSNTSHN